ncbi:calcium-binding protein [Mesorhizobium sp. CN5-321]|uniref:beta strand repeat-containing protein n=1 Tax=Mesorhizobium hunchu TaxID=3157708 RepID=UPI0032B7329C
MPLNLIFTTTGNYTLDDDGIAGNSTSVIRDGTGAVIFTFAYPADSLSFTTNAPGVNLAVNLTDPLGAANFTIGDLASAAASPQSVTIGNVRTTGAATLAVNGGIAELGIDAGVDVVASQIAFSAGTGIGTPGNAIETQAAIIEAETTTGGITLSNFGSVQIGGISDAISGLRVLTSGNISFSTIGSILLGDSTGTESVRGGDTSGNVALTANGIDSDIIANADRDAITVPKGDLVLEAGRDIGFGIIGTDFDNDVRASGSITIHAGRDFLIDGFADLASDDFGGGTGGNVSITAGRNIHVRSVAGTDGSIFANGNAGADVILTTGANGALVVDPASIAGGPQPIASNSGDVIVDADRILIASTSGIGAEHGEVMLRPVTAGREIDLGSAGDAAFALELSDAELDRVFTPNLTIGNVDDFTGRLTVSSAISPANASNLVLRSGGDIVVQAGITTNGSLTLLAGDNVFMTSSPTITVGGAFSVFVDMLGNDVGAGGVADLSGAIISAASIAVSGSVDNDTLKGAEGVDQTVHGNGGNDTIVSSGEGHYYGDADNDLMLAGLSSGIVPEVLDGGAGVDTLDTRSFAGDYTVNLATGATNFAYESFINFESAITGGGNDQIVGTAGNNVISSGAGNDLLNGMAGADTMQGGAGNDTYIVDNVGDVVDESVAGSGGFDRVQSSISLNLADTAHFKGAIEMGVLTGSANVNLTGNGLNNLLVGNAGGNFINGGAGNDTMQGGAGNDTYVVDSAGDIVDETGASGFDRVQSALSINLADAVHFKGAIEMGILTGSANLNLTGNGLNNLLVGNAGGNFINGGAGNDTMQGGAGNDTYVVDSANDIVDESVAGSNGFDRVQSALSINLADAVHFKGAIEMGVLTGSANVNLTGNGLNNLLVGNAGGNFINGGAGADTMQGGAGNDTYVVDNANDIVDESVAGSNGFDRIQSALTINLWDTAHVNGAVEMGVLTGSANVNVSGNDLNNLLVGNAGNNALNGGWGNDTLTGGTGHDTFAFTTALNNTANVDTITDFVAADDTIRLENAVFTALTATGTLAASAFAIGAATTAAQHILYNATNGWLSYDADGSGAGAAIHFATLSTHPTISNGDFVVV